MLLLGTSISFAQSDRHGSEDLPFRQLKGKHLTIVTDLPSSPAIDELPQVFDAAVPQWCAYFEVPEKEIGDWHLIGYLIGAKERFRQAGLLPDDLPPFLNGYQRGDKLWFLAQPSDYYTRHLLLHEGTHGFMFNHLGSFGAPWYTEGIAEHFGTHRWSNKQLQMRVIPDSKEGFPYWGRISLLKRDRDAGGRQPLDNVLQFPTETFQNNRAYAWAWGLVAMLDGHPVFQDRFRRLKNYLRKDYKTFALAYHRLFDRDKDKLQDAWQLFTANIDYGYKVAEGSISYSPTKKMSKGNNRVSVDSSKGWQSSGLRIQKGARYRVAARGRFVIRRQNDEVWWSEPGGVTIEYWRGHPVGMLQAAIRPAGKFTADSQSTSFVTPLATGLRNEFAAPATGILFFRINEMPGELHDNHGKVTVSVKRLSKKDG